MIDLKDAFWACPLDKESRNIFAFEREDPDTQRKQQLWWAPGEAEGKARLVQPFG